MATLLAHIVLYRECPELSRVVESLQHQVSFDPETSLKILVTDNGDNTSITQGLPPTVRVHKNSANLGFSAAQNQGVAALLAGSAEYLLLLNPDCVLAPTALKNLVAALERHPECGFATPKLLRADASLAPIAPPVIDAAGMVLTNDLRHLDRGSGIADQQQYDHEELVFGGTGACLLIRRSAIDALLLPRTTEDRTLWSIYPELEAGAESRPQLFDEAFFAYREDADLAWRGQRSQLGTIYVPSAVGYHERHVLPERRANLDPTLNLLGVRNRFLLQCNNVSLPRDWRALVPGLLIRNLLVLTAVLLIERTSLPGVLQAVQLAKRAFTQRRLREKKRTTV